MNADPSKEPTLVTVYEIPAGVKYLLVDRGGIPHSADLVKALGEQATVLVSIRGKEIIVVFAGTGYVLPEWSNPPAAARE